METTKTILEYLADLKTDTVRHKHIAQKIEEWILHSIAPLSPTPIPLEVKKTFLDEETRQKLKQEGLFNPLSLTGSKAEDIVKRKSKRFYHSLAKKTEVLDLESRTRMKVGSDQEGYIFKEIVPMWLTDPFWDDKVLILDKRRYSIPESQISVEFDALCYEINREVPILEEQYYNFSVPGVNVIDPTTEAEYTYLDSLIELGFLVPYMVIDLKISKENIKTNTLKYKHQLNLCALMAGFTKHSVLVFENNAKIDYWIQDADAEIQHDIFANYRLYLETLTEVIDEVKAELIVNGLESLSVDVAEEKLRDTFKNVLDTNLTKWLGLSESTTTFTDESRDVVEALLKDLAPLMAAEKDAKEAKELTLALIKAQQVPVGEKIKVQTQDGSVSWTKFEKAGSESFDFVAFENYLQQNNLKIVAIPQNSDTIEVAVDLNMRDFYKKGAETVVEYPRFTPNKKDIPDLDWL